MSENKTWFAVEVKVRREASEAIEHAFNNLNSLGTEINHLNKTEKSDVCVIGYFDATVDNENLRRSFSESLQVYGFTDAEIKSVNKKRIQNRDWLAEWKKHWKPTETKKFVIAPSWENVENKEKEVIRIEPNMAFGTGTHETTKLCLRTIESLYLPGMSFFDVGTGTGILSIAAAKISARESKTKIVGCDTDSDSVAIAKENAALNHTSQIRFYSGSISEESEAFDFVCANVTADVIVPLMPPLVTKSRKILVLSGILREQQEEVLTALNAQTDRPFTIETDGEWISITVKID